MYDEFPWIKFGILSAPLMVMMWFMAPTLKWKLLFIFAVPIGVYLALAGKTIGGNHKLGGKF